MAIKLVQGFNITSTNSIDSRMTLTKAEMLAVNPKVMPDKYICVCTEDGKLYMYDKSSTQSATTGYFHLYEEILDLPEAIAKSMSTTAGKAAMEQAVATTLPGAMEKTLNDPTLGEELVNNMFDNTQFTKNVDNKIEFKVSEAISMIEAIDGMA